MVASLIPADANLFALVETAAEYPSREEGDANVGQRWQGPAGVIALMVLDEVLLPIKNTVAAVDNARPIFACFMHSHFVLLPIGLGLESLLVLLFGTISAEHVGFARLALRLVIVGKQDGRGDTEVVCWCAAWLNLEVEWTVRVRRHGSRHWAGGV